MLIMRNLSKKRANVNNDFLLISDLGVGEIKSASVNHEGNFALHTNGKIFVLEHLLPNDLHVLSNQIKELAIAWKKELSLPVVEDIYDVPSYIRHPSKELFSDPNFQKDRYEWRLACQVSGIGGF